MSGDKAKLKASKSQIFLLIVGVIILCTLYIKISSSCCNVREVFLGYGEEDDACIAKLVKQADAGDILAANRLRYPHEAYIKRVCEKGVESLGEREKYYFQDFRRDRFYAELPPQKQIRSDRFVSTGESAEKIRAAVKLPAVNEGQFVDFEIGGRFIKNRIVDDIVGAERKFRARDEVIRQIELACKKRLQFELHVERTACIRKSEVGFDSRIT